MITSPRIIAVWSSRVRMGVTGNLEKTGISRGRDMSLREAGPCIGLGATSLKAVSGGMRKSPVTSGRDISGLWKKEQFLIEKPAGKATF